MLDDGQRGTALVETYDGGAHDMDDVSIDSPAKEESWLSRVTRRRTTPAEKWESSTKLRPIKQKVVKPGPLGMFLKPIGIAIGLILIAYAVLSLGTTFYRSYYRHLDHTAAVHPDGSLFDIFKPAKTLPPDAVDLVVKDVDGNLHKLVVGQSEADKFVNDTILMLDEERARIKRAAHEDLAQLRPGLPGPRRGHRGICRLVLRVEALLHRLEGDGGVGGQPVFRDRQVRVLE